MSGPVLDEYECGKCGCDVRCRGATMRRNLDGEVVGIEEGYGCVNGHTGSIVWVDEEAYSVEGLVER
jgi:hypothetical protein